jgi:hypothetical protein
MAEPISTSGTLQELLKDPQSYVIAVIIGGGVVLMDDTTKNSTWLVGLGLIGFGIVCFIVKLIQSLFESTHKRRFEEVINSQSKAIRNLNSVNKELSKASITAHQGIQSASPVTGNYQRPSEDVTPTA